MRPLDFDFQPRRLSPGGLALLVAGLAALGAAILDYQGASAEVGRRQEELARLQPRNRPQVRAGDDRGAQQTLQLAGTVARDIQRPWDALFKILEDARSDSVALLSLNPDAARGTVQIAGEAKAREAILAFVDRLSKGGGLRNVFLAEDQRQQEGERPYRFLITADWTGAPS